MELFPVGPVCSVFLVLVLVLVFTKYVFFMLFAKLKKKPKARRFRVLTRRSPRLLLQVAPMCGSLNGELLASSSALASSASSDLPPRPLVRSSLSVAPADYPERPEVLLRREASSSGLALKTEVPLHLFSTTNQLHKPVGVQQQIPTKLAALSSSKGKSGKSSRASHRSDSSGEPTPPPPLQVSTLTRWCDGASAESH